MFEAEPDLTDAYKKVYIGRAGIFEQFRKMYQQNYKLDPRHYFSSPGLSWYAILKKINVELELILIC